MHVSGDPRIRAMVSAMVRARVRTRVRVRAKGKCVRVTPKGKRKEQGARARVFTG